MEAEGDGSYRQKGECHMNEKVYRTMGLAGACDIVIGIIVLVAGVTAGVIAIVNGAHLLKEKKNIMF